MRQTTASLDRISQNSFARQGLLNFILIVEVAAHQLAEQYCEIGAYQIAQEFLDIELDWYRMRKALTP